MQLEGGRIVTQGKRACVSFCHEKVADRIVSDQLASHSIKLTFLIKLISFFMRERSDDCQRHFDRSQWRVKKAIMTFRVMKLKCAIK